MRARHTNSPTARRPPKSRWRRGFTLIEAALTTVIVGTGVLSIVIAQQAYLKKNSWAQRSGTGVQLANEVRELMMPLPAYDPVYGANYTGPANIASYNAVIDFAGAVTNGIGAGLTFNPPINALRQTIPNMQGWSQNVKVEGVADNYISSPTPLPLGSTNMLRVTVTTYYQAPGDPSPEQITQLVWVVGD